MLQGYLKDRLLCQRGQYLLCYRAGCLYLRSHTTLDVIKKIRIHNPIVSIPLFERMLRYEPRASVSLNSNEYLIAAHGCIYRYSVSDNSIVVEHKFKSGMKAPLTFCTRYKDGVLIDVLYGEYIQNSTREKVAIYRRNGSSWNIAFEFPKQSIKHIHSIVDDVNRERFLILTGDEDEESGIWETDYEFKSVRKIVCGNQQYRSCVLFPTDRGLFYITDTPLERNYLYKLTNDGELHQLCEIPGPVIYGYVKNNILYFATSVEGDSRQTGIRYLISNKLGAGVKDRYSHLFRMDIEGKVEEIHSFKKDWLPLALFEFGNICFPETDGNDVYVCPQSVYSKYRTYKIV